MEINPQRLHAHLSRLRLAAGPEDAQINDVVLHGQFECTAKTRDGSLVVAVPPLAGVEPLPEAVGVDLRMLIGTLRLSRRDEKDANGDWVWLPAITLTLDPARLALAPVNPAPTDFSGRVRLLRIRPEYAAHALDPTTAAVFLAEASTGQMEFVFGQATIPDDSVSLSAEQVEDIDKAVQTAQAREVTLVGAPIGSVLRGPIMIRRYERGKPLPLEEGGTFEAPVAWKPAQPATLTFSTFPFLSVLHALRRAPAPVSIHIPGPRRPVLFSTTDGYRYALVPREARRALL